MTEVGGNEQELQAIQRLEETVAGMRREIELLHNQQSYLQMQVASLQGGKSATDNNFGSTNSRLRQIVIRFVKKYPVFYKAIFKYYRFLRR